MSHRESITFLSRLIVDYTCLVKSKNDIVVYPERFNPMIYMFIKTMRSEGRLWSLLEKGGNRDEDH